MKSSTNKLGIFFILIGILIQTIVFVIGIYNGNGSFLSWISGCCGIVAVVLCSEKKFMQFAFAFPQLLTYLYISYEAKLWGEVAINIFYFIMTSIAIYTWQSGNFNKNTGVIETLRFKKWTEHIVGGVSTIIFVLLLYYILAMTDDSQPWLDALTTGPAITAQILMTMRYREQWFYWLIIDVFSIVMWFNAGNWCMVMQYIFWTANCLYGLKLWSEKTDKDIF